MGIIGFRNLIRVSAEHFVTVSDKKHNLRHDQLIFYITRQKLWHPSQIYSPWKKGACLVKLFNFLLGLCASVPKLLLYLFPCCIHVEQAGTSRLASLLPELDRDELQTRDTLALRTAPRKEHYKITIIIQKYARTSKTDFYLGYHTHFYMGAGCHNLWG